MNPADLRDQLHASLAPVSPAVGSVEALRAAGLRRRRTREGLAGLAAVVVAAFAAVLVTGGGHDRDALQPLDRPTPSVGPAPAEAAAWETWKAQHPGTASRTFTNSSGTYGATSSDGVVTIARYDGAAFVARAEVRPAEEQDISSLVLANLTGDTDGVPDVVATGAAGNAVLTSVLRPVGDTWQEAGFASCGGATSTCLTLPSATLSGRSLVASLNPCVPSCAEASRRHRAYTWNPGVDSFVSGSRPGPCAEDATGWYWLVTKVARDGDTADLTYRVADVRCDGVGEPAFQAVGDPRHEVVPADLPVAGAGPSTAALMEPGFYEVQHRERTVTGFARP